jgi:hypothetical protein
MPDITMCKGTDCPLKDRCYRAQAKPTPRRQSYFVTPPFRNGRCDHFWDMRMDVKEADAS